MSLDRKTIITNLTTQFNEALREAKIRNGMTSGGKWSPLHTFEVDFMYAVIEIEQNSDHVASKKIDEINRLITELGKYDINEQSDPAE